MSEVKIKIENLYKIFGPRAKEYTNKVKSGIDKDELLAKYNHAVSYTHLTLPTIYSV